MGLWDLLGVSRAIFGLYFNFINSCGWGEIYSLVCIAVLTVDHDFVLCVCWQVFVSLQTIVVVVWCVGIWCDLASESFLCTQLENRADHIWIRATEASRIAHSRCSPQGNIDVASTWNTVENARQWQFKPEFSFVVDSKWFRSVHCCRGIQIPGFVVHLQWEIGGQIVDDAAIVVYIGRMCVAVGDHVAHS